ncbi:hypothetical protein JKP88DRAFT_253135 [Tribonema minus]|uniref:Uncharacterized protein n=1 Tax=Tribonema minus TaxID=303371 RepID=A0A835ZCS9_9STRA|nr:hypothetical protein JKP88DRAFT_253135 [Tribonema minus]
MSACGTHSVMRSRSIDLVTESWNSLRELLSDDGISEQDLECACRDAVTTACDSLESSDVTAYATLHDIGKVFVAIDLCAVNAHLARVLADKYAAAALIRVKRDATRLLTHTVQVLDRVGPETQTLESMLAGLMHLQLSSLPKLKAETPLLAALEDTEAIESRASEGGVNADLLASLRSDSVHQLMKNTQRLARDIAECFAIPAHAAYAKVFDRNLHNLWSALVGPRVYGSATDSIKWRVCLGIIIGDDDSVKDIVALFMYFTYLKEILINRKGRAARIKGHHPGSIMSDDDAPDMIDDSHLNGDEFPDKVKQCAASLMAQRDTWLTAMDAHDSSLHKDSDHLIGFCSYGFSRYMTENRKQEFQDVIGVAETKDPITRDQFDAGSAQFNRLVVTLVQLVYAQVACSTTPEKQHLLDQVNHLVRVLQERHTTSTDDLMDLTSWKLLAGSYAASDVPRCLDQVKFSRANRTRRCSSSRFSPSTGKKC